MNRPVVVLDACVLIPMPLCDTLLRAAEKSLYRFHTSPKILEETHRNLVKLFTRRGELNPENMASRKIEAIKKAFPGVMVEPCDDLISSIQNFPDPNDCHVLAAAIEVQSIQKNSGLDALILIVTHNINDFPSDILCRYGCRATSPDEFLLNLAKFNGSKILFDLLNQQAFRKMSIINLLEKLENGLKQTKNLKKSQFIQLILQDYFLDQLLKDIRNIVEKIGYKDIKNVQSLVGKNYQCFFKDGNLQIRTSSEELLVEYNDCLITVNNISCRDFKIFDSFVIEAKKHIDIFKVPPYYQ